mmetsp:Transcript_10061/g.18957  ORF Transcript_10061/g.18957 Transcript_10061/m.18957 type:complete len:258 (+) Transcript_10061:835-1608(+)
MVSAAIFPSKAAISESRRAARCCACSSSSRDRRAQRASQYAAESSSAAPRSSRRDCPAPASGAGARVCICNDVLPPPAAPCFSASAPRICAHLLRCRSENTASNGAATKASAYAGRGDTHKLNTDAATVANLAHNPMTFHNLCHETIFKGELQDLASVEDVPGRGCTALNALATSRFLFELGARVRSLVSLFLNGLKNVLRHCGMGRARITSTVLLLKLELWTGTGYDASMPSVRNIERAIKPCVGVQICATLHACM